jgi:ribosome-associated protein
VDELEESEQGRPAGPSKSQIKRELLALQGLAERMIKLPRAELERLELSDGIRAAIDETSRIKDQRARRRHFKRIAKLLAREDAGAIRALVDAKDERGRAAAARHHRVERWRERLIAEGGGALTEFLELCPEADRQRLRQALRVARSDQEKGRPDGPRRLFRLLREILDEIPLS